MCWWCWWHRPFAVEPLYVRFAVYYDCAYMKRRHVVCVRVHCMQWSNGVSIVGWPKRKPSEALHLTRHGVACIAHRTLCALPFVDRGHLWKSMLCSSTHKSAECFITTTRWNLIHGNGDDSDGGCCLILSTVECIDTHVHILYLI